jgi:hypothetical protein
MGANLPVGRQAGTHGEAIGMQNLKGSDFTKFGTVSSFSRLTRDAWERVQHDDIELIGIAECLPALGLV